jgi:hypothetical protein
MDVLTEELRRALYADYGVAEVVEVEISAAQTLPAHELERLAGTCDAVVVGIGTCGSCSRWVLHDAIELERHKVPTVSLFTKIFEVLARAVLDLEGFPPTAGHRAAPAEPAPRRPDPRRRECRRRGDRRVAHRRRNWREMTRFASTTVDLPDDSEAASDYLYDRGLLQDVAHG